MFTGLDWWLAWLFFALAIGLVAVLVNLVYRLGALTDRPTPDVRCPRCRRRPHD